MAREIKKLAEIPTLYEKYGVCKGILDRISLWKGDITRIEIDAIVNAANSGLRGGGGVDGAIHSAAGYSELQRECSKIGHCSVGEAVITSACNLTHVKKIIHTVGPQARYNEADDRETRELKSCYTSSLKLAAENDLTSIAFCCISTGIYGFPNDEAAYAAGNSIINFLKHHEDGNKIEKVVLCIFMPIDEKYYNEYFDRLADKYKGVK